MGALCVTDIEELKGRLRELIENVIEWDTSNESGWEWSAAGLIAHFEVQIEYMTCESFVHWSYPWAVREQLLAPAPDRNKDFMEALAFKLGAVAFNEILALGK